MHRDDKPALIALGLMLAAILIVAAIEVSFRYSAANPPTEQSTARIEEHHQHYDRGGGHLLDAPVTDWLMVLLTGMATIISAVAVKLVNDTLKTSRDASKAAMDAVSVTRDIGERQLRPYIVFEHGKVSIQKLGHPHSDRLVVNATFRNAGSSPAKVIETSGALYAPGGAPGWVSKGGTWQAFAAIIGQNQTQKFEFAGISADTDGNFTPFTIGILIWYESLTGTRYEDHVWLLFDGSELRQGFPDMGFSLYRPDHSSGAPQAAS